MRSTDGRDRWGFWHEGLTVSLNQYRGHQGLTVRPSTIEVQVCLSQECRSNHFYWWAALWIKEGKIVRALNGCLTIDEPVCLSQDCRSNHIFRWASLWIIEGKIVKALIGCLKPSTAVRTKQWKKRESFDWLRKTYVLVIFLYNKISFIEEQNYIAIRCLCHELFGLY